MRLGIENTTGLVYTSLHNRYGVVLWPMPVLSGATFVQNETVASLPPRIQITQANFLFLERSFDPVTRIKRGFFYRKSDSQPMQKWSLYTCAVEGIYSTPGQVFTTEKDLHTFDRFSPAHNFPIKTRQHMRVRIGSNDAFTEWLMVGFESLSNGEDLVTLRARTTLGSLPELITEPLGALDSLVRERYDALVRDLHRASPESIIDLCRELAVAILTSKLVPESFQDLGNLVTAAEKKGGREGFQSIDSFSANNSASSFKTKGS